MPPPALPDPLPLLGVLGTIAANRLDGDPVWLVLVGSPGWGKTELLQPLAARPDVYPAATLTEAALLSGTPKKEHAEGAHGGLLRRIGDFGIIVCKDFGSVLSMQRDARAATLAALREVYDGSWTRHVGTDGGRTLHWSGKVGLLAGCTPTIDRHHAVMGAMGERFLLLRLPTVDQEQQAARALAHAGREQQMRRELGEAVADLLDSQASDPPAVTEHEARRLVALASLTVLCRSAVERDGYTRQVELIPDPEAPTRLVVVLERLLAGLHAIGAERDVAWQVVRKAALDSMPALRRTTLEALYEVGEPLATSKLAEAVGYPRNTAERALEDLNAHGVVAVHREGQGKATTWELTPWAASHYAAVLTFPETSEGLYSPNHAYDDISGKVA